MTPALPARPDPEPPRARAAVAPTLLLPAACLLAALAGVAASREPGGVAAVWLPNAVLLGAMLRWGIGWGPPAVLAVAAVALANLLAGDGPALAAGLAAANAAEVALALALARRLGGLGREGGAGTAAARLAPAALVAPLAGATLGAAVAHAALGLPYLSAWRAWWLADTAGMLVVLPPILAWTAGGWKRLLAPASIALASLACALAVASLALHGAYPWPLLAGLPLLAAGLFLPPFVAAAHGLLVAAACVATALTGGVAAAGPFPAATPAQVALEVQLYVALAIAPALAASAAVAWRGEADRRLAESEERYRALVESSPDGVMVERDGVVLYANAGLARMLGAEAGGACAVAGRRVRDFLDPEAPDDAAFAAAGDGAAPAGLRRADGVVVPVETASTRVSFDGHPALQVALRDATGRCQAERARAERARALEVANQELDRFASVVAHDLRAPLRHIGVLAGWVGDELGGAAPPEARERLRQIAERAARMGELIDGLRRYAQAGRRHHATAPVDLEGLVRATIDLLAPPAGFRFELDLRPATIEAAEPPLATVLRNLIANAVRHHDRGGGLVRIGSRPAGGEGGGGLVEFWVEDDGPGIPPRLHVLALDACHTFGPDLRPTGEGVGLALVRRIVTAHGGTVRIGPRPGGARGADVRFTWPATAAAAAERSAEALAA